mmetsp:Transcript_103236/g.301118  ORF Transcript_103236/g.301118 Transcript_103236/m.301118 type:complete len:275 (-) Transcript_103236:59-883(-)
MWWFRPLTIVLGAVLLPHTPALRHAEHLGPLQEWRVPPRKNIKVIGAGTTRSGTQTLRAALAILGYNAAHEEILFNLTVRKKWLDWLHGGPFEPAVQTLLNSGMDATTGDDPWGFAYKEMMQRFPNAKVILTSHPRGAEGWMASVERALPRKFTQYINGHENGWADYWRFVFEGCALIRNCRINETMTDAKREACMANYRDYIDEVRRTVPPGRLLDYQVTQGWGPLAKFLGVPEPRAAFPKVDGMASTSTASYSDLAADYDDEIFMNPGHGYY